MKPTEEKTRSNPSDLPVYLFKQGNNCEAYRYFGAHIEQRAGETGVVFRVWAPHATAISVVGDFNSWKPGSHPMRKVDNDSVWELFIPGMKEYDVYKYCVTTRAGDLVYKADPYAFHAETRPSNGSKVYDLNGFVWHDEAWQNAQKKADVINGPMNIYEMHAGSWKMKEGGLPYNYSELADELIPYITEMGYTHVELLPVMEYPFDGSWGYQVTGYFAPTSRYGTPKDLMAFVDKMHEAGIGVIMDVVYNHTYDLDSCLQKCEPDYYYRMNGTRYSNASACGNEIASEQPMMRKYIVESVCYWAREYHVDGFRFDLMGVLDIDTMNEISRRLKEINPYIILYGEGWTGGTSTMPEFRRAMKRNARMLDGIGMFSDDIRDMVRGHVFYNKDCGYVSGKGKMKVAVRYCATGGVWHPQVDYAAYTYAAGGTWTDTPEKVINYVSCHDNLTLWDKLQISRPDCDAGERFAMNRLAAAMVFTAQGVPFFLGGEEFARTKPAGKNGEISENSYNLPYETNVLRYEWSDGQKGLQQYYRGLIAFRKAHKGLRMTDAEEIRQNILFMEMTSEQTIAFTIRQPEETLLVAYNASGRKETLLLPDDRTWTLYIDDLHAGTRPIGSVHSNMELPAIGCVVLGINELSC